MPLNIQLFKTNLIININNVVNSGSFKDPMWGPRLIVDEYFNYLGGGVVGTFPVAPVISSKVLFLDEFLTQIESGSPDPFFPSWLAMNITVVGGATAVTGTPFSYKSGGLDSISDFVDAYGDSVDVFTKGLVFALPSPLTPASPL